MCKKGLIVRHLRIIYANFLKNKAFKIVKYIVDTMFQKLKYYPVKFTERANMRLSFTWSKSQRWMRDYMLRKMFSQFLWPGASEKSIYFQLFLLELKKKHFYQLSQLFQSYCWHFSFTFRLLSNLTYFWTSFCLNDIHIW